MHRIEWCLSKVSERSRSPFWVLNRSGRNFLIKRQGSLRNRNLSLPIYIKTLKCYPLGKHLSAWAKIKKDLSKLGHKIQSAKQTLFLWIYPFFSWILKIPPPLLIPTQRGPLIHQRIMCLERPVEVQLRCRHTMRWEDLWTGHQDTGSQFLVCL